MIAELLVSIPLGGLLAYGLLEARRSPIVGVAMAALALVSLALAWLPGVATNAAAAAGFGSTAELLAASYLALTGLALVNVHVKLRRQMHVVTRLARELALAEAAREAATAAETEAGLGSMAGDNRAGARDVLGAVVEMKPLVDRRIGRGDDHRGATEPAALLGRNDDDIDEGEPSEAPEQEWTARGSRR